MSQEDRDRLAMLMFPREWIRANNKPRGRSKARNNLRKRAEWQVKFNALKASGASCATCRDFQPCPSPSMRGEMICDQGSDFHGYQMAKPDGLCTGYVPKATP